MNSEISPSTITAASAVPHCQQRTPSARRCRMAVSDPDSGLCTRHAAELQKDLDQADLAASLIGDIQEFRSAAEINHSLGELYKLQARNKITPRRAAVMATLATSSSAPFPPSPGTTAFSPSNKASNSTLAAGPIPRTALASRARPAIAALSKPPHSETPERWHPAR